jgi:hypothetical protein
VPYLIQKKWKNEFRAYCTVFNPKNDRMNSGYIVQYLIQKMAQLIPDIL